MQFEEVWNHILRQAGRTFRTKTGLEFTYRVAGGVLVPSRTRYQISRSDFEATYNLGPISGPGQINNLVRGPAYVWAILHDTRVSGRA